MAINPYTLNKLYENGILDYVPQELLMPTPLGAMTPMQNPYLNSAMSGSLYQNYGSGDTFSFNNTGNYTQNKGIELGNSYIGAQSGAGANAFGLQGIGAQSNAGTNAFGLQGIGTQSNAGVNAFGLQGIGAQSNAGINAFGIQGIGNFTNNISNGFKNAGTIASGIPNYIKGLASLGIIALTISALRGKKKAPKPKTSFLTGLNPKNWNIFRKSGK